jgi:Concanavalin A-like lectin/glucanases superfamily
MMRLRLALLFASALVTALGAFAAPASAASRPSSGTYVVGTYDGSTLRLFVDGRRVAEQRTSLPVKFGTSPVEIGSFFGGEVWYGTLDEVALYDRALDPAAITQHYQLGSGTTSGDYGKTIRGTPGVVAYWRLDDPTSKRAGDALGRHPGVYHPMGTALRVPGLLARDPNHAAAFDGANGDVVVGSAQNLSLAHGFTIEAWTAAGARRDQTVVAKADSWFLKTNVVGQWGVGFFSGKKIVSIYARQATPITAAPIAQSTPPPTQRPKPAPRQHAGKRSSGTSTALILWLAIIAAGAVAWLVYRYRRRARAAEGEGGPEPQPGAQEDEPPEAPSAEDSEHETATPRS